jgi:hypothetical protein
MDGGEKFAYILQQLMLGRLDLRKADFGTFVGEQLNEGKCFAFSDAVYHIIQGMFFQKQKCGLHKYIDAYYLFFSFLLFGSGHGDCCFLVVDVFSLSVVVSVGAILLP